MTISPGIFKSKVDQYFSYLIHDYGFRLKESECSEDICRIVYESSSGRVSLTMERTQLFIDLAPLKSFGREIDLGHIILFRDSQSNFKYALTSNGPDESEFQRLATLLQTHCKNILTGDFSEWDRIIQFREDRAKAKYGQ